MSAEELPSEVHLFLSQEVRTLLALELLLLLRANANRRWTIADISRELRATNEWAEQELTRLSGRGFVHTNPNPSPGPNTPATYTFTQELRTLPPSAEFAFGWLAASYPTRRFSIIQALYAAGPAPQPARPDALNHFADAFKIRKEPPNG